MASEQELYYIQNVGYVGNCLLWWRPNGNGYTCDLDDAWRVTKEKADDICRTRRGQDIAWPVSAVDSAANRHLDCETWRAYLRANAQPASEQTK